MIKFPIPILAEICESSEAAVVAAGRILGKQRFGNCFCFEKRPGRDFLEEVIRADQSEKSAAAGVHAGDTVYLMVS